MTSDVTKDNGSYEGLYDDIKQILISARTTAVVAVNTAQIATHCVANWVGRIIDILSV